MTFWIITCLLAAAASLAVLWPLSRPAQADGPAISGLDVYRDQLDRVEAQIVSRRATGRDTGDLDAERAEIARRLLKAAPREDTRTTVTDRPWLGVVLALALPFAVTLSVYPFVGAPGRADAPLQAQASRPLAERSLDEMIAMAERRLEADADDARGWAVLATVYERAGRFEDRERALRNLVRLGRGGADGLADLAETIARVRGNVVTAEARGYLQRAIEIEPTHRKANFYLAMAAEQDGDWADAAARWTRLAVRPDQPKPFVDIVVARRDAALQRSGDAAAPGPGPEDVAAAATLDDDERSAMIEGMVSRLAARLEADPDDPQGWERLIRAYRVLGRADAAREALDAARRGAGTDAAALSRLDALERSLDERAKQKDDRDGS